MKAKFSTHFFNVRLFLEGLKRLRVIGTVIGVLSVVFSAVVPITSWMNEASIHRDGEIVTNKIDIFALCPPLYFVIFLVPLFFFVIFSFLHKRKESDFFHAIPYTRTCVYVSFVWAALALAFGIQILSATVAGLLWAACPYTYFALGDLVSFTLICMLASAMLSGFMMLSLSLTGTPTTTLFIFFVFAGITRMAAGMFSLTLDETLMQILPLDRYPFLYTSWFLPFGVAELGIMGNYSNFSPLDSPANIIYSLVVTILLFAVAWFFYKKRKSEMAGHTAPNRVTQHIFRCLVTLPMGLLITYLALADFVDSTLLFVLVIILLLVYYLYEIITTKRIRNCISATPWLLCVVAGMMIFAASVGITRTVVINEDISADEVKTVSVDVDSDLWDEYQELLLMEQSTNDEEIIGFVTEKLALAQSWEKNGRTAYDCRWHTVKITLDGGRTLWRKIPLSRDANESAELAELLEERLEVGDSFLVLPNRDELYDVGMYLGAGEGHQYPIVYHVGGETDSILSVYYKEYDALTADEKALLRGRDTYYSRNDGIEVFPKKLYGYFHLNGRHNGERYTISVYVDESTPRTFEILKTRFEQQSNDYLEELESKIEVENQEKFENESWTESEPLID